MSTTRGASPLWLSLSREAVAQTPGELAGSPLRPGSENGHLIRHARVASGYVVGYGSSGTYFVELTAGFRRHLYATASAQSGSRTPPGRAAASHGKRKGLAREPVDAREPYRGSSGGWGR